MQEIAESEFYIHLPRILFHKITFGRGRNCTKRPLNRLARVVICQHNFKSLPRRACYLVLLRVLLFSSGKREKGGNTEKTLAQRFRSLFGD